MVIIVKIFTPIKNHSDIYPLTINPKEETNNNNNHNNYNNKNKSWTRLIAFHIALISLKKDMNPINLPPAMGK